MTSPASHTEVMEPGHFLNGLRPKSSASTLRHRPDCRERARWLKTKCDHSFPVCWVALRAPPCESQSLRGPRSPLALSPTVSPSSHLTRFTLLVLNTPCFLEQISCSKCVPLFSPFPSPEMPFLPPVWVSVTAQSRQGPCHLMGAGSKSHFSALIL